MNRFIIPAREALEDTPIGGKAFNLARLIKADIPVPRSFFVRSDTLDTVEGTPDLRNLIDRYRKAAATGERETLDGLRKKIEERLRGTEWPGQLRDELREAVAYFEQRGVGRLAVRSSGQSEDAGAHSYAGLFESILNVDNKPDDLIAAIKKVWLSAFDERILAYARRTGLPDNWYRMGVVVQEMIDARLSGVFFSVDPVSGQRETAVLEYVEGNAEQLVQGAVTPQRCLVRKKDRRILSEEPIKAEAAERLRRVIDLSFRVQNEFGCEVDVEWAADERQVYILQARPVTTADPGDIIWTDENVGEVIPDIVTPFSWSLLEPVTNEGFRWFLRRIGVREYPAAGLFGLYEGKVYFNQTAFRRLLRRFYLSESAQQARSFGKKILPMLRSLTAVARLGLFSLTLPRKIRRFRQWHREERTKAAFAPGADAAASLKAIGQIRTLHRRNMALHIACTIVAELYYQMLSKLCSRWLSGSQINADVLLAGLHTAESADSGRALWQIAEKIRQKPGVRALFEREEPDAILQKLAAIDEGNALLADLDQFIENYGHGALHEFELYYPRWREDKRYILNMLKTYVSSGLDFEAKERDTGQQRLEKRREALAALGLPRRQFFAFILNRTEIYSAQRENLKQDFLRAHSELKKHLLNIGEYLRGQNLLEQSEDILFFEWSEIEAQLSRPQEGKIDSRTARERRQRRAEQERTTHPKKMLQRGGRFIVLEGEAKTGAPSLKGIGCSAGIAEGPVKIITDPVSFGRLQKGDILVARSTNPGWTPLFVTATAVVTEIGGALSHGAIIAREYGLPMVAAVPGVTTKLKDGMRIRVNGFSGEITVLETADKQ